MKFMSKLLQILGKGAQLVGLFQPIIQTVLPQSVGGGTLQVVSQDITEIGQAIVDVDQIGAALQLKGVDKLTAATPKVADIFLRSALMANHKVGNQTLFMNGCKSVASGVADIINSWDVSNIDALVVNKSADKKTSWGS